MVRAVVFDVGETLVDETGQWQAEAERLGLTPLTFFAALGAIIERGDDHRLTWALVGKDREPGGLPPFSGEDLYPDALPCLRRLRAAGYRVGLVGNQPERAEAVMSGLGAPVDFIASSGRWGVEKPSPGFFERICVEAGLPARAITYVGDRLDNDVLPAKQAGMTAVFIRRGPWGYIHAARPEVAQADGRLDSLDELDGLLAAFADRGDP